MPDPLTPLGFSTSAPGGSSLYLADLTGSEGLSRLFAFDLHLVGQDTIDAESLIGQNAVVSIAIENGMRYINGYINHIVELDQESRFVHYSARLVPWMWFMTRSLNSRIFQSLSATDILRQVFDRSPKPGSGSYSVDLGGITGNIPARAYCVQYRETDFNFVSRLMEEEGIFYFFEHDKDSLVLKLADSPNAHASCPLQPAIGYRPVTGDVEFHQTITSWSMERQFRSGKYRLASSHYQKPRESFTVEEPGTISVANNDRFELYDYPGEYAKSFVGAGPDEDGSDLQKVTPQGERLVKIRMQEEEVQYVTASGASTCPTATPGYKFSLEGHPHTSPDDWNSDYVVRSVSHSASQSGPWSGSQEQARYANTLSCIPLKYGFRPPRVTGKPVVQGPQTALVVGQSGEEIWTDKYGRVKVQFYWDREGNYDDKSSCWIRVAQVWAGKQWGAIHIPRVGQEVIVDFLEGDPDQPIITGRVYNAEQMPPYALPDNQTRSSIKSRSSKGGGADTYNELRFEDKKGSEQFFQHAQKDLDTRVVNESREWVGASRHLIVTADQKESVGGDKHLTVTGKHFEKISGEHDLKIVGDQKASIGGQQSLNVGGDRQEQTGSNWAHAAGQTIYIKGGMTVVIEAGMQLSLKAAGGFVDIGPAGVTIQGTLVQINSGGSAASGSGPSLGSPQDPKAPDQADDGTKGGKI